MLLHSLMAEEVTVLTRRFKKSPYLKYGYFLLVIPVFFLARYYYFNDPEVAKGEGLFPRCFFHAATGFHCPGCGSQRAVHDLLHLRIGQALRHNVLIVIVAIALGAKGYAWLSKRYFLQYYFNLGHSTWFALSIVFLLFAYWILRNIPTYPFTALAP